MSCCGDPGDCECTEKHKALIEHLGMDPDDAAHMLVDSGEVDTFVHEQLLSEAERNRIYG